MFSSYWLQVSVLDFSIYGLFLVCLGELKASDGLFRETPAEDQRHDAHAAEQGIGGRLGNGRKSKLGGRVSGEIEREVSLVNPAGAFVVEPKVLIGKAAADLRV